MRLFIAINFSHAVCSKLLALRDQLRSGAVRGSFSLPDNLHLTLVFLCECGAKQAAAVKAAMDAVSFHSFPVMVTYTPVYSREAES